MRCAPEQIRLFLILLVICCPEKNIFKLFAKSCKFIIAQAISWQLEVGHVVNLGLKDVIKPVLQVSPLLKV